MIQGARDWCTGNDPEGWDGEGGEGRVRMGNTCTLVVDSCQCMVKPIQYCKVISLQSKFLKSYIKNKQTMVTKVDRDKLGVRD